MDLPGRWADLFPSEITQPALGRMAEFLRELAARNENVNLVSVGSEEDLVLYHLIDSLMVLRHPAARASARAIDVGSGGGFPGLPLALARPDWSVTLLEAVRKKQVFLDEMVRRFSLKGPALWARAEVLARDPVHRDAYDLAFCRAVGSFPMVLELALPFLKPGGALLAHRGDAGPAEAAAAAAAAEKLGGRLVAAQTYELPGMDKKRCLLHVEKTGATPPSLPRRPGRAAKKPL